MEIRWFYDCLMSTMRFHIFILNQPPGSGSSFMSLLNTKPIPEAVLTYDHLDYEAFQWKFIQIETFSFILWFNTLRLKQNGCHFPENIFKYIFWNEIVWISIKISLKFVPECPVKNIPALVQIMAWHWPGNKLNCLKQWWLDYSCMYILLSLNEWSS